MLTVDPSISYGVIIQTAVVVGGALLGLGAMRANLTGVTIRMEASSEDSKKTIEAIQTETRRSFEGVQDEIKKIGSILIHQADQNRRIIHLEEDVAKSFHFDDGTSGIDFNRAGTPLMEIVTEPDLESGEEAFAYLRSLQMILQQGGVSDADMEKGQLRCDVNISLRKNPADP